MELCLLNLLILIHWFSCNYYHCVLFESLSHVINHESHVYSWNLKKIYLLNMGLLVLIIVLDCQPYEKNQSKKKEHNQHCSRSKELKKPWFLANLHKITFISFECYRSIDKSIDFYFFMLHTNHNLLSGTLDLSFLPE